MGGELFGQIRDGVFQAVATLSDDAAGGGEDFLCRTIVVGQDDDGWVMIVLTEALDIADIGALEAEYGLVVVADCHDVWFRLVASQIE